MAWFFTEKIYSATTTPLSEKTQSIFLRCCVCVQAMTSPLFLRTKRSMNVKFRSSHRGEVTVDIISQRPCENEPDVFVTLYQALPKGDKMDFIVQKCTELGISRIVPMISARCVSRPDEKSLKKKCERWQKIALQAAMQSRRGIIPEVTPCISFKEAAEQTKQNEKTVFFTKWAENPSEKF